VRALTRKPDGRPARALAVAGAEVVAADMDDPGSLDRAFTGADGVYSVQSFATAGLEGEVRQGKNVGDAAARAGVSHLVYGSAAPGRRGTGVASWESKLAIEDHLRTLDLPLTVLRPTAFMELMTDRDFYPAAGIWHVWPGIAGWDFRVPWLSCADLGAVAATVFADPARYVGTVLELAADDRSLAGCREAYARVTGRRPRSLPMPLWLFQRFTPDTVRLWRSLAEEPAVVDVERTRAVLPGAMGVEEWLRTRTAA
jgi:uncharacterized protein YbjT (DUF2867 family)